LQLCVHIIDYDFWFILHIEMKCCEESPQKIKKPDIN